LKPILKVEHQTVAEGEGGVGLGVRNNFDMHFIAPHPTQDSYTEIINNTIVAGMRLAVALAVGAASPEALAPKPYPDGASDDQWKGGKLWETAMLFLDRVNGAREEAGKTLRVVCVKDVDEAIVGYNLHVASSFGTPLSVEWKGLQIDADRIISTPVSVDATYDHGKAFMHLIGAEGSLAENRIFEDVYGEEAVSAIKILALASEAGIPICTIRDDINQDCPGLNVSEDVRNAVTRALSEGRVITIPEKEITHFNWRGTGYIDLDLTSLGGGYMISGGYDGGATAKTWDSQWAKNFATFCGIDYRSVWIINAFVQFPFHNSFFPWFDATEFRELNRVFFTVIYTSTCSYYPNKEWKTSETYHLNAPVSPKEYIAGASITYGGDAIKYTLVNVELTVSDAENPGRTATSRRLLEKTTIYIPETLVDGKSTGKATIRIAASKLEPDNPAAGAHSLWAIKGDPVEGVSEGSFAEKTHTVVLKPGEDRKYLVSAGVDMEENGVLDEPHEVSREIEVIIPKITSLYIEDPDDVPTPPGESVT
ncbi:MAG: hypothetical protein GY859_36635, partial [Desulfobacterales bacterium]|nr:hypothetical protein [Desulfobacterales bacterium]